MKKNKFLTALLALAIALGLWFYVVTVVKPDTTNTYYNIPVVLDGERFLTERNLMIIGGQDSTVTMELYGNRIDLDKVNSGNITLIADLSKIYGPGEVELTYSHRFPGDVPSGALTVQSKSPSTVKLTVVDRDSNDIPVKLVLTGEAPDPSMYLVDEANPEFDVNSIHITGPKDVIAQIDHAAVVVDLTGKTQSFKDEYRIMLCDKAGNGVDAQYVGVSQENVNVTLNIYRYKNVRLDIKTIDGGGATRASCKIDIIPDTIKVSGNENALSKLPEIILATVDLSTLTEPTTKIFTIPLDEGFKNLSGVTEATVSISFPGLDTKELSVTNIQVLNVPEGMSYELLTQAQKITIRGPKDAVKKVSANDLTATIDLSEADAVAGTRTYNLVVTVDKTKHPSVGVIDTYVVGVTLKDGVAPASEEALE